MSQAGETSACFAGADDKRILFTILLRQRDATGWRRSVATYSIRQRRDSSVAKLAAHIQRILLVKARAGAHCIKL